MKNLFKLLSCVIVSGLMIGFTSCSKDEMLESKLVGKWELLTISSSGITINYSELGLSAYFEFEKNGTGKAITKVEGVSREENMTWKCLEGQLIMSSDGEDELCSIEEVTGSTLVLVVDATTDSSLQIGGGTKVKMTFKKVK